MLDDLTTPLDLEGQALGPVSVHLAPDRVSFFVEATGDDADTTRPGAPPGFAAVLLFAVADLFLYHPKVVPFTATLLHLDQSFTYPAPMRVDATITMEGTITRVRERSGSFFVTFVAHGIDDAGVKVLESTSTFVLSDQRAPAPAVTIDEPAARFRAEASEGQRSASRHDLVRYAAATRDFNPLHWDHDVAVEAGLPGIVVHGLLMFAWMLQAAERASAGRVTEARVRFRSALHAGDLADVSAVVDGDSVAMELSRQGVVLVTGTASVAGTSR
jgi:3-hydroxybutyryl-CoA dehydratase